MKKLLFAAFLLPFLSFGQTAQNPVIKSAGGIFQIDQATVKPDPSLEYNIIIDVATGPEKPEIPNPSIDNVARLINLHVIGGVPKEKLHIVMAVHNESTVALMNDEEYKKRFGVANPNLKLIEELEQAGVKVVVCGQSLLRRNVDPKKLAPGVEIGTSMLTTVTTYQLKGYAHLKF